jgi:hypothetical protein
MYARMCLARLPPNVPTFPQTQTDARLTPLLRQNPPLEIILLVRAFCLQHGLTMLGTRDGIDCVFASDISLNPMG